MTKPKIEDVIKYLVELADNQGFKLTTIYLVKLLYLVDLGYCKTKSETYTGWEWKFHSFGPWTFDSLQAINSALKNGYIKSDSFASKYEKESFDLLSPFDNYTDKENTARVESALGFRTTGEIKKLMRQVGADTYSMLNHVYEETEPMINAVPGETLNFNGLAWPTPAPAAKVVTMSGAHLQKIKDAVARMKPATAQAASAKHIQPIYDEVYFKAIEAADQGHAFELSGNADVSEILGNRKSRA